MNVIKDDINELYETIFLLATQSSRIHRNETKKKRRNDLYKTYRGRKLNPHLIEELQAFALENSEEANIYRKAAKIFNISVSTAYKYLSPMVPSYKKRKRKALSDSLIPEKNL